MYIFDAVSFRETQQAAFSLLAPGGTLVVVTQPQVNGGQGNKKVLMVIGGFHFPQNRALGAKFSIALTEWLAEGAIKVCISLACVVDGPCADVERVSYAAEQGRGGAGRFEGYRTRAEEIGDEWG